MKIRFGVSTSLDNLPIIKEAGYDYLEYNFQSLVNMSDDEFHAMHQQTKQYNMTPEVFNCFFPVSMSLVGNCVDYDLIAAHAEKGLARASYLGGVIAVIGSGGSRRIPEGFDYQTAYDQFIKVVDICGNIAGKHGMMIALEPLNTEETNLINTFSEGLEICRKINNPHVKCLADFYHIFKNGESPDTVEAAGNMLCHVHLARPNADRGLPQAEDIEICRQYADILKRCGYTERLSLECNIHSDFETGIRNVRTILDLFH